MTISGRDDPISTEPITTTTQTTKSIVTPSSTGNTVISTHPKRFSFFLFISILKQTRNAKYFYLYHLYARRSSMAT